MSEFEEIHNKAIIEELIVTHNMALSSVLEADTYQDKAVPNEKAVCITLAQITHDELNLAY